MMPAVTDGAGIDGDRGAAARVLAGLHDEQRAPGAGSGGAGGGAAGVLAGLDDKQRAAVTAPAGPVCILAGAGTGKTRAITHRIAYRVRLGQVSPQHVLAVTFTARAAAELRSRLAALGAAGVVG